MPLASLSKEAVGIIGGLISLNGFVIWHLFKGLTQEIKALGDKVEKARNENARLVHKTECHISSGRVHSRLDEVDAAQDDLSNRVTRVETRLDGLGQIK